jgi:hypothetical protein
VNPDSERAVADALGARAAAGRPNPAGPYPGSPRPVPPPGYGRAGWRPGPRPARSVPVGWVMLIGLLVGVVLGIALALVSLFAPGALPAIGPLG